MTIGKRGWPWAFVAAVALCAAGCGGAKEPSPAPPAGGAGKATGQVTVKCAGCGKTETVAAGAAAPYC